MSRRVVATVEWAKAIPTPFGYYPAEALAMVEFIRNGQPVGGSAARDPQSGCVAIAKAANRVRELRRLPWGRQ